MSGHPAPEPVPESLRSAVLADLKPVRPLGTPLRRAFGVALPVLVAIFATAALLGSPPTLLGIALALTEWLAGLGLVAVAFRESVPGRSRGGRAVAFSLVAAVAAQSVVAVILWLLAHEPHAGPDAAQHAAACFGIESVLGILPIAAAIALSLGTLPLFPVRVGLAAGAAAGLFADALWQLVCTKRDLAHLVMGHTGAVVTLALVGTAVALATRSRRAGKS